jgi:anti-sigma regulatory factor (Ser/Thr protein kinase)
MKALVLKGSADMADTGHDPSTRFALTPAAPAAARRWIEASVPLPDASHDAILLLLSELVSNSVQHSGKGDDQSVEISVRTTDDAIHVEVKDPGAGGPMVAREGDPEHFGLRLVDSIADHWGYSVDPMTVWFEVANP